MLLGGLFRQAAGEGVGIRHPSTCSAPAGEDAGCRIAEGRSCAAENIIGGKDEAPRLRRSDTNEEAVDAQLRGAEPEHTLICQGLGGRRHESVRCPSCREQTVQHAEVHSEQRSKAGPGCPES